MSFRFLLLALLLASTPVVAQTLIAPPPPLISSPGADRPVQLQSAAIGVRRAGGQAHTTIELVLHNPSARPLEGQLAFPLRDGQQVAGFALDIGGEMHDAVPVTKERGREVFEAIERRRVDPALLERTEGNHFRLRVFPVPAGGERRVRLELVESLPAAAGAWELRLPLQFAAGLTSVPLRVAGPAPLLDTVAGRVAFAAAHGIASAELGPRQLKAADGLVLRWPQRDDAAATEEFDGDVWFVAELALPDATPARRPARRIGLLWDASGSAAARDTGVEFALLDRYFAAAGDVEVQLQLLRDRASPAQRFQVRGGDWTTLKDALRAAVRDGATDLGAWTPQAGIGEYLLVSDGLANFGDGGFPTLAAGQRLFAINSAGAAADTARLQALAEARGGWLVDVAGAAGVAAAADALLREHPRIVAIDAVGATDVVAASPFPANGRLRIGGRLTAAQAEVQLTLAGADGRRSTRRLAIAAGEPAQGRFLAQVVAGWRLRQLLADPAGNRTAIRLLGQRYGLVTAETSLLVLETLDDYVRYDIVPPPALRAQFFALRQKDARSRDDVRRARLDEVAAEFAERQAWWATDFSARRIAEPAKIADGTPVPTMAEPPPPPEPMPLPSPAAPVAPMAPAPARAEIAAADAAANAADLAAGAAEQRADDRAVAAAASESTDLDTVEVTGSRLRRADIEGEAPAVVMDAAAAGEDAAETSAVIAVQPWAPDSDVARRLRAAAAADVYALYLDERAAHADSPAFFLDVADILLERGQRDLALRVLSNLAEMQLENRQLLRVLGYRLMQADAAAQAVPVFARVRTLADEEPQSHRDLGLALDAAGRPQEAVEALYEVVARPWDGRFGGIALIALAELNAIVARHPGLDVAKFDPRLLHNLPMALRAVLSWDADATDMDLWVIQPDGEEVSYSHQNSAAGGRLSRDFTGGYGPEEYAIRRAGDGRFRIEVDHYGSSAQLVTGAVTVQVWLSTGFATPGQQDKRITVRLEPDGERLLVGEFAVD